MASRRSVLSSRAVAVGHLAGCWLSSAVSSRSRAVVGSFASGVAPRHRSSPSVAGCRQRVSSLRSYQFDRLPPRSNSGHQQLHHAVLSTASQSESPLRRQLLGSFRTTFDIWKSRYNPSSQALRISPGPIDCCSRCNRPRLTQTQRQTHEPRPASVAPFAQLADENKGTQSDSFAKVPTLAG